LAAAEAAEVAPFQQVPALMASPEEPLERFSEPVAASDALPSWEPALVAARFRHRTATAPNSATAA